MISRAAITTALTAVALAACTRAPAPRTTAPAAALAAPAVAPAAEDDVDRIVRTEMTARRIPGLALAVIRDGVVVRESTYGVASVELGVPVTSTTVFTLASTTKELTGVAIMALVEDGRVSLDESIRRYLPELPAAWAPVTIRHCLAHTSGLPDGVEADPVNITPLAGDRDELLARLKDRPLGEPGRKTVYNQTEFMVLGDIVARVSGVPYERFIEERLWRAAHIPRGEMQWGDAWAVVPGRASLYTALEPAPDRMKLSVDRDRRPVMSSTGIHAFGSKGMPAWLAAAGGLNASIRAMAAWEAALWRGDVIQPATLEQMAVPARHLDGSRGAFGLAVLPGEQDGTATVSSGGGAAVWLTTVPARRLTVIVLTNLQGSRPESLVAKILSTYLRQP